MARISHEGHDHPKNPHWYKKCRASIEAGGGPVTDKPAKVKRGREAVSNALVEATLRQEAEASTALDGETQSAEGWERRRNSLGRFTKDTLDQWQRLFEHLEGAREFLVENGAELLSCELHITLGGQRFRAFYDGHEWAVEVVS